MFFIFWGVIRINDDDDDGNDDVGKWIFEMSIFNVWN